MLIPENTYIDIYRWNYTADDRRKVNPHIQNLYNL